MNIKKDLKSVRKYKIDYYPLMVDELKDIKAVILLMYLYKRFEKNKFKEFDAKGVGIMKHLNFKSQDTLRKVRQILLDKNLITYEARLKTNLGFYTINLSELSNFIQKTYSNIL